MGLIAVKILGNFWAVAKSFEERIDEVNLLLTKVAIRQRGGKLSIRGTFPPKPGDGKKPKSYEISTGKPANPAGLQQVRAMAQEIESQLIRERFDWTPWLRGKQKPAETVGEWIEKFTADHWANTPREPSKLNSWHKDYELKFSHLPLEAPLTLELLKRVALERSAPASRSRVGYVFAYRRLAEFAGLSDAADLANLGKGYSGGKGVNPRSLPSDSQIAEAREKFKGGWLWVYEAIAVYGLRPHEVFLALGDRLEEEPALLEIPEETKTGIRLAFPIPADVWQFDFRSPALPEIRIEGRNNNELGMAVSQKFRQLKVGFNAYDLRHCFARRGFEFGFPPDFLAKSMGHSLEVHLRTYRAWWGEQPYLKVYREIMARRL